MEELEILKRRLEREKKARKAAEAILEAKALELYEANQALANLNNDLEQEVEDRTAKLQESETRYRHLVENASDIIYNVDEEGYFTFVNAIGAKHFQYSEEEIIGQRYVDFVHQDYKEKVFAYYTALKDQQLNSDYHEFPVRKKDGTIVWLGQNVNRIEREDGSFYFSAVARDISQRKRTELALEKAKEALTKSEIKYRSIIENMDLGLLEVDNYGTIIRVYDGFNEMTGYQGNELVGSNAEERLLVPGYEKVIATQNQNRIKGEANVYEIKIRKKSGEEIWVLISGAPFYDENEEVIGSIGIHYDITSRKRLESELEVAKQKAIKAQEAEKQFLAHMSHEIRTPLNAIIGMSHLLQDGELNPDQQEYLQILDSSAGILKNLISDILDFSKIDAGTIELQERAFDLLLLCQSLVNTFSAKKVEKPVVFDLAFTGKPKYLVQSDAQLLNQVLINLIGNAEKFTEKGSIKLKVHVEDGQPGYYTTRFVVTDTGLGIAAEDIEKIFKQFKQASGEIRTIYGGTGLGLAISQKIIKLLGGEIGVESILGKGSSFYFTLQLKKGPKIAKTNQGQQIIQKAFSFSKEGKILVVEDNPMNLKYISSLLQKWEVNFLTVTDGLEAIEAYKKEDFDLIFMDLQMPRMDGFEATKTIRVLDEQKSKVPIIALTASSFLSEKNAALEAGINDFLSKPFTPDQLVDILSTYLPDQAEVRESTDQFNYHKDLDTTFLQATYGDDLVYAHDMFDTFLSIVEEEKELVTKAIVSNDIPALKKQLHKIKPIFKMVGLKEIGQAMETFHQSVNAGEYSRMADQFREIATDIDTAIPLLKLERNRMAAYLNGDKKLSVKL